MRKLTAISVLAFSLMAMLALCNKQQNDLLEKQSTRKNSSQDIGHTPARGSIERVTVDHELAFFDRISTEPVPLDLVWWSPDRSVSAALHCQDVDKQSLAKQDGYWHLKIPDSTAINFVSLQNSWREDNIYLLPYSSVIDFKVVELGTKKPIAKAKISVLQMDNEDYWDIVKSGGEGVAETFIPEGQPRFFLDIYLKANSGKAWSALEEKDYGSFKFSEVGQPLLGVKVEHPEFGAKWFITSTSVGEIKTEEIEMIRRPTLKGRLTDKNLIGLANRSLDLMVWLDNQDPNMGAEEETAFSLVTAGIKGDYQRAARTRVRTGPDGEFSLTMPRGLQYALEYRGADAYGFTESAVFTYPPTGDLELDVIAQDFAEGYEVLVRDSHGNGLKGVFVEPNIADDYPWFRQMSRVVTNSEGRCFIPFLNEDMDKIRFYIYDESGSNGYMHRTPNLIRLPAPPHKITIDFDSPDDAMRRYLERKEAAR